MTLPRRNVPGTPEEEIWEFLNNLAQDVGALQRATTLRNASISGGTGLRILNESAGDGQAPKVRLHLSPNGTITAFDVNTGDPVVRMGRMVETGTAPGADPYGIEVKVGGNWVQLGAQDVAVPWANVTGKPGNYNAGTQTWWPTAHPHPGTDITSPVADAQNSQNAGLAQQANGSQWAHTNVVAGTQSYAVWVGNDGGFHFGRTTSSRRRKENIRDWAPADFRRVLSLRPRLFDRKAEFRAPEVEGEPAIGPARRIEGRKNEYGMIAEEVNEHLPEVVTWYDGEIDGIQYELIGVALIPVVRDQEQRISALEGEVEELREAVRKLQEKRNP